MTLASEGGGARLLVRDVLLRDGSTLRLQAPVPSDFGDIKAFYDGLLPESRYFRFHGYGRTILRFTLLLAQVPEIVEADLNPVRCMTSGCLVLDMRLRIEHQHPIDRVKTW